MARRLTRRSFTPRRAPSARIPSASGGKAAPFYESNRPDIFTSDSPQNFGFGTQPFGTSSFGGSN